MPQSEDTPTFRPLLADETDVYRMLLKPSCITPTGQITSLAFLLRPADEGCLSVTLRGQRTEAELCTEEPPHFKRCVGIGRLRVGQVRAPIPDAAPLAVIQDALHHACIDGLPLPANEVTTPTGRQAQRDAEYVGNELAKRAALIWHE